MRLLVALLALSASGAGCASIAPRLPAPLPADAHVAIGATGAAGIGSEFETDVTREYELAFGGAHVAARVLDLAPFSVELDVGAGGGGKREGERVEAYLGTVVGARAWYALSPRWSAGVDVAGSAMAEVGRPPHTGLPDRLLQLELRALVAHRWHTMTLATRPGLLTQLTERNPQTVPLFDVPLALVLDEGAVRAGVEAGVIGTFVPFPVPGGVHVGVQLAYVF